MYRQKMNSKCGLIAQKIHHIFFSVILCLVFFTSPAISGKYTCPTYQKYTSCNSGYFMSQKQTGGSGTNIYIIPNNTVVAGNTCSACSKAQNYDSSVTKCPGGTFYPRYAVYVSNQGTLMLRYRSADDTSGLYDSSTVTSITTNAALWFSINATQQTYYDFMGIFSGQNGTGTRYANADGTVTSAFETFAAQTSKTVPTIYTYHTMKKASCNAGQYLKCITGLGCECTTCPAGSYCSGVTNQTYSLSIVDYGKTACPTGMTSQSGATKASDCYIVCEPGTYYKASTKTCTECPVGSFCRGVAVTGNQLTDTGQSLCTDYLPNTTTISTGATSTVDCVCKTAYYMNKGTCKACSTTQYTTVTTTDCTSQIANATAATIHRTCTYTGGQSDVIGATSAADACTGATGCTNNCVLQSCATDYTPGDDNTCILNEGATKTCSAGYYLKCTTTSCTCQTCPAGYYCTGGTYNQVAADASIGITGTIKGGVYNTGCGTTAAGAVCSSAFTRGQISAGYWSSGGGTSPTPTENGDGCVGTNNTCGICPGSAYSATGASACTLCPAPYRQSPVAGHSVPAQCQVAADAGYRVSSPAGTVIGAPAVYPVTGNFSGWFTTEHYVNYGNISPTTFCMQGYKAISTAADPNLHRTPTRACVIDVPAGYQKSSYLLKPLTTNRIRLRLAGQLKSTNSQVYIYEFSVPALNNPSINLLESAGCTMSITSGGTTITDADKATDGIISYDNYAAPNITGNVIILEWNCPVSIPVTQIDFSIATTNTQYPYFNEMQLYTDDDTTLFNSKTQYNANQFFTTTYLPGASATAAGLKPVVQTVIVNPPLEPCDSGFYNSETQSGQSWYSSTSCTRCSTLGGITAGTYGTYSSVSPYDASTTCRFTPNATTPPEGCATITPNTVAYDGTAWGDEYYSVTAQDGYSVLNSPSAAPTCPIETYTITYELNGGTNSEENPTTYTVTSDDIVLAEPTRSFYEFGGWYTDTNFTTLITSITTGTTGNITLYAKWTPSTLNVNFNQGGGDQIDQMTCVYGTEFTLPPAPNYTGYTFNGWVLNGNTLTAPGQTVTCNEQTLGDYMDIFFVVERSWTPKCNAVTLDFGDTQNVTTPKQPIYKRTDDDAWYSDALCANPITSLEPLPTLSNHTFEGCSNNGFLCISKNGELTACDIKSDTALQCSMLECDECVSPDGTVGSCEFLGIQNNTCDYSYTCAPGYHVSAQSESVTTANTTSHEVSCDGNTIQIHFDTNGGTATPNIADTTCVYGGESVTAPAGWVDSTDTTITRTGYTFGGWQRHDNTATSFMLSCNYDSLGVYSGSATIPAVWNPISYTVEYNPNKPSGASTSISGATNSSTHRYDIPSALTTNGFVLPGYTFASWNTAANGSGDAYQNGEPVKNLTHEQDATVTLYAQWTANPYKVRYNANGGTGTMSDSAFVFDKAANLTANAFAKTGCKFTKWNTVANGTGTSYNDKQSVINMTTTRDAIINLYAQWTCMNVSTDNPSKVYDGTALTCNGVTVTQPASGVSITYSTTGNNGSFVTAVPTVTDVEDSKTIYFKVSVTGYSDYTGSFECNIKPANMGDMGKDNSKPYDGTPLSCTGELDKDAPKGSTIKYGTTDGSYTLTTAPTITEVKYSKTIYYQVTNPNYETKTGSFRCEIEKADSTLQASSDDFNTHFVYNSSRSLGFTGVKGTLSATSSNTDAISITSVTNNSTVNFLAGSSYGTATITITDSGNDNYKAGTMTYTLYADEATITLNNNGGSGGTGEIYQRYNTNVWKQKYTDAMTTTGNPINVPSRTGYAFDGYYANAGSTTRLIGTNGYITSAGITAAKALQAHATWVAKWTPNKITIKYDSNGGSAIADMTCDYDSQITLANAPANSGNQFSGWSLNGGIKSAGATITCNQATLGITSGSITATAIWGSCPAGKFCPADKTEPQDCPDDYPNSTAGAVSDAYCYLTTETGKYVETQGAGQITCKSGGHYCPGGYTIYYNGGVGTVTGGNEPCSELDGINISTQGITYSTVPATGASQSSQCRLVGAPITITGCSTVTANTVAYNGTKWGDNYYTVAAAPGYRVGVNNAANPTCVICGQDTYQQENNYTGTTCTECLDNYYTYGNTAANHDTASDCQISCPGGTYLANANDTTCTNVGAGNWAANSIVAQGTAGSYNECADGLTTIGYGTGANEADDCGRIFNFGDKQLYLRSAKRNDDTPALHVQIGDTIFYGTMKQVTGPQSGINAAYDGKNYLIVNDEQ